MSSYEKKCLLINEEIDNHGMGRYQWYIWILCGLGYLIDLLWAQAFGLVLGPVKQELGFADNESGNISVAFSAGLTAGAFTWGVLVDIIGRKWAFNLTVLISGVFGMGLGGCTSYTSFLVVTAFVGFGIGGNIPIDTTICLEFIPQNKRFLLALLSIFQPIGVVLTSAIAYGFIPNYSCEPNFSESDALPSCRNVGDGVPCCGKPDNMGWRYLMFTLGAITLTIFLLRFAVFNFQESPKYLLYRGHNASAVTVLEHVATTNGKSCGVSLSDFDKLDEEESLAERLNGTAKVPSWRTTVAAEKARFGSLFSSWQMSRLTILVWLTYICDASGFTLAGRSFLHSS
jgi:MFS family permease